MKLRKVYWQAISMALTVEGNAHAHVGRGVRRQLGLMSPLYCSGHVHPPEELDQDAARRFEERMRQ